MQKYVSRCVCSIVLVLIINILMSCAYTIPEVYIFNDITECSTVKTKTSAEVQVEIYQNPSKDLYLKDLGYNSFFGCFYISREIKFEIFAYEFVDSETAKDYFTQVTGKNDELSTNFSSISGSGRYRKIVINGKNAYTVYSSAKDSKAVNEFIGEIFTIKLDFNNSK